MGADLREQRRTALLIAGAILLIVGPILQHWSAQPASRYLLTVAIVDDHSLELDPYVGGLGLDRAQYRGHVYSDKAPYQALLAAPAFQAYRAAGGDPFPILGGERRVDVATNYGLWWVTLWSATLPAIVLTLVVRRLVATVDRAVATKIALAITLATTTLPFASWLFGHVLAAMWVALAWHLARPEGASPRAVLAAGLCLGAGIGTEYAVAALAVLLLLDQLLRQRWSGAVSLSLGTVLTTLPLLLYNWLVFEDPFEVSYQGHLPSFEGKGALGVYNLELPRVEEVGRALVGDRGLFVLTPIVLCAVVGCLLIVREAGALRRDAMLGLTAMALLVVISTGIDGLGGDSPGPRYLIPVFPLLAIPLVTAWRRAPLFCAAASAWGFITMWMASVTVPDVASTVPRAFGLWTDRLLDGDLVDNVLTGSSHRWVLFVTTGCGLTLVALLLRSEHAEE